MWKNPSHHQPDKPEEFIKKWMDAEKGSQEHEKLERKVLEFLVDRWEKTYTTQIKGKEVTLKAYWDEEKGMWTVEES